jgi:transmembrane sensor
VAVTRGKVSVSNGSNGAELLGIITPNEQISFNTTKSTVIIENVNAQQVIAWQLDNILKVMCAFNNASY